MEGQLVGNSFFSNICTKIALLCGKRDENLKFIEKEIGVTFVLRDNFLKIKGYRADASLLSVDNLITKGAFHSNWSERHTAFAAGLGTFSLSDALISNVGCNIRLVSVITDAPIEVTPRKSDDPYANCLFYAKGTCKKCVERCPYGCISENGHDRMMCAASYGRVEFRSSRRLESTLKPHYRRVNGVLSQQLPTPTGCALCQFEVPCMDKNPMANEQ